MLGHIGSTYIPFLAWASACFFVVVSIPTTLTDVQLDVIDQHPFTLACASIAFALMCLFCKWYYRVWKRQRQAHSDVVDAIDMWRRANALMPESGSQQASPQEVLPTSGGDEQSEACDNNAPAETLIYVAAEEEQSVARDIDAGITCTERRLVNQIPDSLKILLYPAIVVLLVISPAVVLVLSVFTAIEKGAKAIIFDVLCCPVGCVGRARGVTRQPNGTASQGEYQSLGSSDVAMASLHPTYGT